MQLKEWMPIYREILLDFGFDSAQDEHSARILSRLLSLKGNLNATNERLQRLINGRDVLVCGNAPTLANDIKSGKIELSEVILAADGATSALFAQGIIPRIIVSDLDGSISDLKLANALCAIMVVHAHGDNIDAIQAHVPSLSAVLGTTQARPTTHVFNFGGFTDGDRAIFLANEYGARAVSAIGFDFYDKTVSPTKRKKLQWAKKLLELTDVNFR
jgi:uncharacterized Rossmann fold enzyme